MKAPVFVKIDRYREVEETIRQIKAKIEEAMETIRRIQEMKAEEEHEIAAWTEEIRKVNEKIEMTEEALTR